MIIKELWEQRKVRDVADKHIGGGTPSTKNTRFWDGNIPWIQSSSITENNIWKVTINKHISEQALHESAAKLIPKGSIAVVTRVGVGKIALMNYKYSTSQDFLSLVNLQEVPSFITLVLYQQLKIVSPQLQGTSIKGITSNDLLNLPLKFPNKYEQSKIVKIVKLIDRLITLQQRKLEQSKQLKKAMLQRLLVSKKGKLIPNIRFKDFTETWEQRKFGDIANRESKQIESTSDIPSVEYDDIVSNQGNLNKDISTKKAKKKGIEFNDTNVLYGKLRPYLHNWLNASFTGVAVGDWWVLKPVKIRKNFLYYLIQTKKYDNVANLSSGSKMPRSDWNLVSNTAFSIPNTKEEQEKIGIFLSDLDSLITLHQRRLNQLSKIKKFCLQKMFI